MNKFNKLIVSVTLILICNVACVGQPQIDAEFGKSVAVLKDKQVYDRKTLLDPGKEPPMNQDGLTAVGKLEGIYREAKSSKTSKSSFKRRVFHDDKRN